MCRICVHKRGDKFFPPVCGKLCGECGKEVEYEKGVFFLQKFKEMHFPE
jgi:hypothetical protein